jgi:hypothetical protein
MTATVSKFGLFAYGIKHRCRSRSTNTIGYRCYWRIDYVLLSLTLFVTAFAVYHFQFKKIQSEKKKNEIRYNRNCVVAFWFLKFQCKAQNKIKIGVDEAINIALQKQTEI